MANSIVFALATILIVASSVSGRGMTPSPVSQSPVATSPSSSNIAAGGRCRVQTSLDITVKAGGSCYGSAKASCSTEAQAQEVVQSFMNLIEVPGTVGVCDTETVLTFGHEFAEALANVYVSAFTQVECTGYGLGCGFSVSRGNSYATSYVDLIVKSLAEVADQRGSAICEAKIRVLSVVIANAVARAQSESCLSGGPGFAQSGRTLFVSVVSKAIAEALALATAELCAESTAEEAEARANCESVVSGTSDSSTTITTTPDTIGDDTATGSGSTSGSTGSGGPNTFGSQLDVCVGTGKQVGDEYVDCCDASLVGSRFRSLCPEYRLLSQGALIRALRPVDGFGICYCY